jgi:hypothetical protein
MTAKQRVLYFKLWRKAAQAQGWIQKNGRVHEPARMESQPQAIWDIAQSHAEIITERDLRHAAHQLALGSDKPTNTLSNRDLDLLFAVFQHLAQPTLIPLQQADSGERRRHLHFLQNRVIPSALRSLALDTCKTEDIDTLTTRQLHQLVITLKNRPACLEPF